MDNDLEFAIYNFNKHNTHTIINDNYISTEKCTFIYESYEGPYKYVTINGETRKYLV